MVPGQQAGCPAQDIGSEGSIHYNPGAISIPRTDEKRLSLDQPGGNLSGSGKSGDDLGY
ncbi:hypothetical protein D3C85_1799790 [compost metagenome]